MWLFPAYLLAMNLFVLPIALGGLLLGLPVAQADTFVLSLPLEGGRNALSWLVFLGGFSAGTGMIIVETTALATMISNDVVVPAADRLPALARAPPAPPAGALGRCRGHPLRRARVRARVRRALLPRVDRVRFLRRRAAARARALVGSCSGPARAAPARSPACPSGFAVWAYTLVVPVLARSGWLPDVAPHARPVRDRGAPSPRALFDVHLDPVSHAVLWTLILNGGAFALGSLLSPPSREELRARRSASASARRRARPRAPTRARSSRASTEKRAAAASLLARYHGEEDGARLADACLARAGAPRDGGLSALQLAQLQAEVETTLASAIGSAAAHAALRRQPLVLPRGVPRNLGGVRRGSSPSLNVSPAELERKREYHRERERIPPARGRGPAAPRGGERPARAPRSRSRTSARTAVRLPVPQLAEAAVLVARAGRPETGARLARARGAPARARRRARRRTHAAAAPRRGDQRRPRARDGRPVSQPRRARTRAGRSRCARRSGARAR